MQQTKRDQYNFIINKAIDHLREKPDEELQMKSIQINKFSSQDRSDKLFTDYPSLRYFRPIFVGYFATNKKVLLLSLILAALLCLSTFISVAMAFGEVLTSVVFLFFIYFLSAGLLVMGLQTLLGFLGKNSDLDRFKRNVVDITNRFNELNRSEYVDKWKITYEHEYVQVIFYPPYNLGNIEPSIMLDYYSAYFNRNTHDEQITEDSGIYFTIRYLEKKLNTEKQQQEKLQEVINSIEGAQRLEVAEMAQENEDASIKQEKNQMDVYLLEKAEKDLDNLVGLDAVKDKVTQYKDNIIIQLERIEIGQNTNFHNQHMLFTGNPGTGKTTVARIMADIFKALGMVSKGHLIEVTRKDLVGEHIGHTAPKTNGVIQQAIGGVLFIDEAYSLTRTNESDFGIEAVDELVKSIVVAIRDRSPLLDSINVSISSVYPAKITTRSSLYSSIQISGRNDVGNGRAVDKMLQQIIDQQSKRLVKTPDRNADELKMILPEDIVVQKAEKFDLEKELSTIVGNEEIKNHIRTLGAQVKLQKQRREKGLGTAKGQSLHMVFKGNPGTGKTTFARIIAMLLKEIGIIKSGHLVETDRSKLVGAYIGHTEKNTEKVIKQSLGGVLFIDEAYTLADGYSQDFGSKAISTIMKAMEDYRENLVVIVAGYNKEMEDFLAINPGLESRFPYTFEFKDYTEEEMFEILIGMAEAENYVIDQKCNPIIKELFREEINSGKSGNGRYVRNLFNAAVQNLSVRLFQHHNPDEKDLQMLKAEDFQKIMMKQ
ncbi:AAA family ATPase [Virgibacillus sp. AGTR]|uniref:AAA family ATPase n=1 Tax=Virgibacillus sp. AGTR TaxID=2812055 RepID=UPI001D166C0C|nr:AAA family ATPase [Virgibacillus sp. AGTR]MCC2252090.1 AAA family ATPase [Virgibacillus sp. AGTR]